MEGCALFANKAAAFDRRFNIWEEHHLYHSTNWKKTFTIIYIGQAFSLIGSSAVQFSIIWWLTVKTDSAIVLTIASIVGLLPQALIGPFAGVWVDRYDRKMIMIVADGIVALSSGALAVVFLFGSPPLWVFYLIAFIRALGSTFHAPAMQASIPLLVPQEKLTQAGGWGQLVNSASFMVGPVIGAALMGMLPLHSIMLVDLLGAAFAISALLLVKFPKAPEQSVKLHLFEDLRQGFHAMRSNKPLMAVTIPVLAACIVYMPLGSLLPLLIRGHYSGTAWHSGASEFLFAAGMALSASAIGIWGGMKRQFLMISIGLSALGLCAALSGMLPGSWFAVFATISFIMGGTGTFFNVPYTAYIQRTVPPESMGKVFSLVVSGMSLASPVGLILAGPLSEVVGITNWFTISGILMLLTGIICYLVTRRYDRPAEAAQPNQ